ncbi:hypothetical protein [Pseudorhodoplanes sinuspersici]|uniref:Uncharacterized protein n=1 Tax=Pseudorhodoplanes sinuspersici TaxID=1235591 RepID=A0A1W6ZYQ8_9HYPH|nr:hypothetical protein [Pseudorhodoplanes sinuspersici]ARQ02537.1 hypothetical protein CAK95_28065 [Pseudorhodoplanes sinuspersici]RKE74385.1 hypothetical protein DFP91_2294 [Pseudorhodoplanes sinuspersici]
MSYDPYDPYRNTTSPPREPYQDFHRDPDAGTGTSFLLGALILVALGAFIYYYAGTDRSNVATNDMRPPITQPNTPAETTGSNSATPKPERPAQ